MVLCIIALPILAVLSLFSVKYRKLAKDSLECVFRAATFSKCESGLDERIKAGITGRMLRFSPAIAGFVYRNYKLLSVGMLVLFLSSFVFSGIGIYNYYEYGNCNGPEDTGFCVLDPSGSGVSQETSVYLENPIPAKISADDPIMGNPNASLTIIEFGCYACTYTKAAEPIVKYMLHYYNGSVNLQFKTFVIKRHNMSYSAALAANCAMEQGKYSDYHDYLFSKQDYLNFSTYSAIAMQLKLNMTQFESCIETDKYGAEILNDTDDGLKAGVQGTPTFFIGDKKVVGPKPFKTFKKLIDDELR